MFWAADLGKAARAWAYRAFVFVFGILAFLEASVNTCESSGVPFHACEQRPVGKGWCQNSKDRFQHRRQGTPDESKFAAARGASVGEHSRLGERSPSPCRSLSVASWPSGRPPEPWRTRACCARRPCRSPPSIVCTREATRTNSQDRKRQPSSRPRAPQDMIHHPCLPASLRRAVKASVRLEPSGVSPTGSRQPGQHSDSQGLRAYPSSKLSVVALRTREWALPASCRQCQGCKTSVSCNNALR